MVGSKEVGFLMKVLKDFLKNFIKPKTDYEITQNGFYVKFHSAFLPHGRSCKALLLSKNGNEGVLKVKSRPRWDKETDVVYEINLSGPQLIKTRSEIEINRVLQSKTDKLIKDGWRTNILSVDGNGNSFKETYIIGLNTNNSDLSESLRTVFDRLVSGWKS